MLLLYDIGVKTIDKYLIDRFCFLVHVDSRIDSRVILVKEKWKKVVIIMDFIESLSP